MPPKKSPEKSSFNDFLNSLATVILEKNKAKELKKKGLFKRYEEVLERNKEAIEDCFKRGLNHVVLAKIVRTRAEPEELDEKIKHVMGQIKSRNLQEEDLEKIDNKTIKTDFSYLVLPAKPKNQQRKPGDFFKVIKGSLNSIVQAKEEKERLQEYEDVLEANKDRIEHIGNVLQMKARVLTIILKSSKSPQHVQEKIDNVISAVEKDSSLTAEIISGYTDKDIDQFRFLMLENHANAQEKRMENASPDQRFENFYNSFSKRKFSPEFLEIIEVNREKIIEILADFRLQHAVLRNIVSQAEVSFLQEQIDHILKELRENKRGDVSAIRYADSYRFLYITKTQQKQKMRKGDDFFKLILSGIKFIVQSGVERKRLQEYKDVLEDNKDKISHIGNVLQMKPRVLAMILRSPSDPQHLQQKIDNVSNIFEKRPDLTAEVISKYTEKDVDQFRFLMLTNLKASQARERNRALLRGSAAGKKRQEEERQDGGKMPRMDDRDYGGGGFEGDGHTEGGLEFERFPEDFLAMPISNDDELEIDDGLESEFELYFPEVPDFLEVPDFSEMLDCLGVPDLTMVGVSMEDEEKVEGGTAVEGGSADATVQGSDSSGQQGGLASGVSRASADNLKKGSVTKTL